MAGSLHYLLALDLGTTSTKVLAWSLTGEILNTAQRFHSIAQPGPGYAEQSAEDILAQAQLLLQDICDRFGLPAAICVSGAMHSLLVADVSGKAITPALLWADTRSSQEAEDLQNLKSAPELVAATGTPLHPMSPLSKLRWLKNHAPHLFRERNRFVSIKEYVLFHLTGAWVVDESIASATGLFDVRHRKWYDPALALGGLTPQQLSEPVDALHQLTWKGIPMFVGASDGCLAHYAGTAYDAHAWSLTWGTSAAVRFTSPEPIAGSTSIFSYRLRDTFVCGGASNNGTLVFDWWQQQIGETETPLQVFLRDLPTLPAGSDGLLFLPYLTGERAPLYDPHMRAAWIGLGSRHTPAHFRRAMAEGICFEIRSIVDLISQCTPLPHRLLVTGGATRSSELMQLLADVLNLPLHVLSMADGSCMGGIRLACEGLGMPFKIDLPHEEWLPGTQHALYDPVYQWFTDLTYGLQPLLRSRQHPQP